MASRTNTFLCRLTNIYSVYFSEKVVGGRLFLILPYKELEFMASHSMKQLECALSILITPLFPSLSFSCSDTETRLLESQRESQVIFCKGRLFWPLCFSTENSNYFPLLYPSSSLTLSVLHQIDNSENMIILCT